MNNKILTISIACYNVANTIAETIDSLITKNISNLEIILVNDGSTDNTLEILNQYKSKYPQSIIVVNKKNGGWGSTVNSSIEIANGKYLKLIDGDDWYDTNVFETFIEKLKCVDSDIVLTDFTFCYDDHKEIINFPYKKEQAIDVKNFTNLYMHSIAVKTNLLKNNNVRLLEHCFYTDTEFNVKSMEFSTNFIYLPINIYQYRMGSDGQSVSKKGYVKHYKEHELVLKTIFPIIKTEKFNLVKTNHFDELMADQLYIYLLLTPTKEHKTELKSYVNFLKINNPISIKKAPFTIKALLKTNYIFYKPLSKFIRKKNHLL